MYDFTILIFPGAFASSVAATLDILGTAATLAQRQGLAVPRWRVCGPQSGLILLGRGMQLLVDELTTDVEDNSCWVIPGLGISDFDAQDCLNVIERTFTTIGKLLITDCIPCYADFCTSRYMKK